VTPCIDDVARFGSPCFLHLQGVDAAWTSETLGYPTTTLHDFTVQKT